MVVQRGGQVWRPQVTPLANIQQTPSGPVATQTSLAANKQPSKPVGTGHNARAVPFAQVGGKKLVASSYNNPAGLYSDHAIAEALTAQAEVLDHGVVGVNFMKNEKAYSGHQSDLLKMVQEMDDAPRAPSPGIVASSPSLGIHESTVQGQSFKLLERSLGEDSDVINQPSTPTPGQGTAIPPGENICPLCGRLIVGVFLRIKNKNIHAECFKCVTCGMSLKNKGYYNINDKTYCDIHAGQAARQNPPAANLEPVTVNPGSPAPRGAMTAQQASGASRFAPSSPKIQSPAASGLFKPPMGGVKLPFAAPFKQDTSPAVSPQVPTELPTTENTEQECLGYDSSQVGETTTDILGVQPSTPGVKLSPEPIKLPLPTLSSAPPIEQIQDIEKLRTPTPNQQVVTESASQKPRQPTPTAKSPMPSGSPLPQSPVPISLAKSPVPVTSPLAKSPVPVSLAKSPVPVASPLAKSPLPVSSPLQGKSPVPGTSSPMPESNLGVSPAPPQAEAAPSPKPMLAPSPNIGGTSPVPATQEQTSSGQVSQQMQSGSTSSSSQVVQESSSSSKQIVTHYKSTTSFQSRSVGMKYQPPPEPMGLDSIHKILEPVSAPSAPAPAPAPFAPSSPVVASPSKNLSGPTFPKPPQNFGAPAGNINVRAHIPKKAPTGGISAPSFLASNLPSVNSLGGLPKPTFPPSIGSSSGAQMSGQRSAPRRGRGIINPASGSRVPICSTCQRQIRGPFVSALGKTWCPDCFMCGTSTCKRQLIDVGFVEEQDNLYCEMCYEQYLAPICAKCDKRIKGECLRAIGKFFHPECFCCAYCGCIFGSGPFYLEDGLPYCEAHWNDLFTTKCISCQFPIEAGDRWVEALNNNYHSQCFKCSRCHRNLEGQAFFAKGGKPFCKSNTCQRGI